MVDVICVCKNDKDVITHIGVKNTGFGDEAELLLTPEEAYEAITKKGTKFEVPYGGKSVEVVAIKDKETQKFKFLRTSADGKINNNLDKLRTCKKCGK